ncbi:MAG: enoyl-CoA hydratase/isomerase family protein [Chloroflexi bacterium]|nr:enoyl-CoA hydratase/isomerase family protein [Chloroflexota bacterium]
MTTFATLLYDKPADDIAWITLNRPQRLNALSVGMRDDLWEVLHAVRDDPEVRVAVFQGAGDRAFCTGADLSEFLTAPPPAQARQVRWERDLWGLLATFPKPLVAAIHGFCIGSGCEIAMLCDLRVCSEDARFAMPETGLGIIPAAGGSQTLPRTVGEAHALSLLLTGEFIDAQEARRIRLVQRVVPRADLYPTAAALARRLVALDQGAVRRAKAAILRGLDMSLDQGLALEARLAAQQRREHRAALRASAT